MRSTRKNLNRWTPYVFNNGMVAKNRVVVPPMASGTGDLRGFVTPETIAHYHKLTQAHAGILFVEYTTVHRSGRSESNQLSLESDEQIPAHAALSSVIKQRGNLAGIQLVHAGGKSSSALTGGDLIGPSPIAVPTKDRSLEIPIELNSHAVETYQSWYVEAAIRSSKAGYDAIELHAAHGYGLNQWLSPLTNQRLDEYGGSLINRSRMLLEIFKRIRISLPDKILGVRIPGEDHFVGGLTQNEMVLVSQKLYELGADFVDVSSGIGGWRRPSNRQGEGYLLAEAAFIQKQIEIPVVGVGGIESGSFIDDAIDARNVAFTAVGRKILKDPLLFFREVLDQGPCYFDEDRFSRDCLCSRLNP